jgi:hypothetical protein
MQDAFAAYAEGLGKTIANLQSLEFLLRLFLHNTQQPEPRGSRRVRLRWPLVTSWLKLR